MPLDAYRAFSPLFSEDLYPAVDLRACVEKRKSEGGTSAASVERQIAKVREKLL